MEHGRGELARSPTLKKRRVEGSSARLDGPAYTGFTLGSNGGVGRVRYADLTPEGFYKEYVAIRRPVLIEGCIPESEGWKGGFWTNHYLRKKAGDTLVKVEWRAAKRERFGQGREKAMEFGEFLGELERGNELLYLTTQDLGVDAGGRPRLMSAPLDRLKDDFPMRPRLMGGLVPQNVNLWIGLSRSTGSSSGLHHDFHDNLYVLLRGQKTFRLFSPGEAHRMYLEGDVIKVHQNGRINYRGKETLADGADPLAETAARAAALVDQAALKAEREQAAVAENSRTKESEDKVAAAQAAVERGEKGAEERLAAAEEELEEALEAVLDAECGGGGGFGGDFSDDSSEDEDEGPGFFDGVDDNPSEDVFAAAGARKGNGRRGTPNVEPNGITNDRDGGSEGDHGDHDGTTGSAEDGHMNVEKSHPESSENIRTAKEGPPSNFSRVDPSLPRAELEEKFPLFLDAKECSVDVRAGQMLYLPAGWFHEVSSLASDDGHMAFNYWFHPPDAGSGGNASSPYTSRFWQNDWDARQRDGDEDGES